MTMQKVTLELQRVEMQAELLQMQTKDNTELLSIAQSQIVVEQRQRHVELLEKNQNGELTPSERQELSQLRIAADRFRKTMMVEQPDKLESQILWIYSQLSQLSC
ncbi:hypothetical protein [Scytonema sp. UIC 10036]|uniref:hypothetical protein n=1 Tax=Scytonema sp. UIC 10036 TaxID=2304196 RepID=UPI001A9B9CBD|nr:hypothetical protein [Scytonema sp. UIC 10036]